MNLSDITHRIEEKRAEIEEWFEKKRSIHPRPIYGSVDVRDAGWKVGVVDANHFPAGFNNIDETDKPHIAALLKNHILRQHPDCSWVHLYPESHTRNPAYVENVRSIQLLIEMAGFHCTVGSVELSEIGYLNGINGPLKLSKVELEEETETMYVNEAIPCLILLNNDLTEQILPPITQQHITPSPQMGWFRRKKSEHYQCLRPLVNEISELIGIDPWHLLPDWFVSEDKCLDEDVCRKKLAGDIDEFLSKIRSKYEELGIEREPVAVVKNDSGTYGLGVLIVHSGDELLNLSNRKLNKLRYAKGGSKVENFLIQEGIPTRLFTAENKPAEPVGYLVDGDAASWFYRINAKKSDMDNLNSPSAEFKPRSEMEAHVTQHADNWHTLVAELSMLAMGAELQMQSTHEGET